MAADYSSFGLRDKVAIVTGASQGIGKAIALGLAQAGAHVVLAKYPDGRDDKVRQVQSDIEALGRKALIVPTDVSDVAQVRTMVETTAHRTCLTKNALFGADSEETVDDPSRTFAEDASLLLTIVFAR